MQLTLYGNEMFVLFPKGTNDIDHEPLFCFTFSFRTRTNCTYRIDFDFAPSFGRSVTAETYKKPHEQPANNKHDWVL